MVKYTLLEQAKYYAIRFLKVALPTAVVLLPTIGLNPTGFLASVLIPAITTLDKYARNQGWYSLP